jgi:hypothetical protein
MEYSLVFSLVFSLVLAMQTPSIFTAIIHVAMLLEARVATTCGH